MPRRSILSATERESLLALPDAKDELIRHYTFNETDLSVIRQRRGARIDWASLCSFATCDSLAPFWASMSLRFRPVAHGGRATQDASGKLERVRPARTDTAGALGRAANGFWVQALHHEPLSASRAYIDRAGLADRQRHRAGERTCRESAAAEHYPARHECHRARKRRGHHPCQPTHLRGADRFFVITPPSAPGRTSQAQGRQ